MDDGTWTSLGWVGAVAAVCLCAANLIVAQQPRQAGTLVVAGQPEQAALVRIDGRSYVDIESLARITHGTLRFEGSRTILTLPGGGGANAAGAVADAARPPRLTEGYLSAEIQALTQLREWHVALVNAVKNNQPVTEAWVGPMHRSADAKLQLALAAATSAPDQQAAGLLRNQFANVQQMSDQLVALHDKAAYISPDVFNNNPLDAKIQGCEQALAAMSASKQYQDEVQCH